MLAQKNCILFWFILVWPSSTTDLDTLDSEIFDEERWMQRNAITPSDKESPCLLVHPSNRDIIKRFQAILPYFDKDHSNMEFLHKYRASVFGMSAGDDPLDREAAFYAAVVTPIAFLQNYRDTWCLLERFHRALRLYQVSHPTEKRSALKLLQNFRTVNHKVRGFVWDLPGPDTATRTSTTDIADYNEEELHDKKGVRFYKELIKSFG